MICRFFQFLLICSLSMPILGCGSGTRTAENINPDEPEPPTDPAEMERLEKEMQDTTEVGDGSDVGGPPT
jgi:hypothetical protein